MGDVFREVTRVGVVKRAGNSFTGVLFGLVLCLAALFLQFWNEGRAVQTARSLKEGLAVFVQADPASVQPANEGKLVHLTAPAQTAGTLTDPEFAVTAKALKLQRKVEMYQWVERTSTRKRSELGGGETQVKEYRYEREWQEHPVDSSKFKDRTGHENPAMPFSSRLFVAPDITVGAYRLSDGLVSQLDNYEPLRATAPGQNGFRLQDGGYYKGGSPSAPAIGDLRITFAELKPGTVSLLAMQSGTSFAPYKSTAGDSIETLVTGAVDGKTMFKQLETRNTALTWGLRGGGFLLLWVGMLLLVNPMQVLASVIPLFGRIVGAGLAFVSFLCAAALSLLTCSVAWIWYRPVVGVTLLILSAVALFFLFKTKRTARTV